MFFLLYKTYWWQRFWWFSEDFRPLSEDFRRFSKIVPKARRTFPNIFREFPKISEDVRRLPKTFEKDPKMFRWYTNEFKYNLRDKLDSSEIIDIFTCVACELALHLGLTRDLFLARFSWVSREIWVRAARGLGRGRGKESLPAWLKNFHFHFAWAKRDPIGWKWHASIKFRGECRNVLNRVPGGGNVWK